MTDSTSTDVVNMSESSKALVPTGTLPSAPDAACPSSTTTENAFSGISSGTVIAVLVAVIHAAIRQHPSNDSWYLAFTSAARQAKKLGITDDEFDEVMTRVDAIRKHGMENSMWPKGFF